MISGSATFTIVESTMISEMPSASTGMISQRRRPSREMGTGGPYRGSGVPPSTFRTRWMRPRRRSSRAIARSRRLGRVR